ncbi:hypothetical protein AB0B25_23850 [Nocardia sp. NPDC049190]|uniref:hypothetical protein n=1 Tax=Nocardia sp. NPDC049190 TaxID=3155650 RepID=UPI0033FA63C5
MLGIQLAQLLDTLPAGVSAAVDVVSAFDDGLVPGLARLGPEQTAAYTALSSALGGSPLAAPVADAVEKLGVGAIGPDELAVLAGGRAALLGAVHDALLDAFDTSLSRTRNIWSPGDSTPGPAANVAVACRSWLQELAITGWRGVDHELVSAVDQTVEALLADPGSRRLAFLLDGLAAELRACCPVATMDRLPVRRWADLWSRALLLSWRGADSSAYRAVSGRLLPLVVDVHEHGTAVQIQTHAVLEDADGAVHRVRVSVAAAKVDTIVGPAVWQLFGAYPRLMTALAERRCLDLAQMPLAPSGDLVWRDDHAEVGEPADPFATAHVRLAAATAPAVPPLDRDPVHIAEPVLIENYRITGDTLELEGHRVALELDRLPRCGPLTPAVVTSSTACLGLIRFDAGSWSLRPLAVRAKSKGKIVEVHGGDWACGPTDPKVIKAQAKSGDALAVLRERAGRLLRA